MVVAASGLVAGRRIARAFRIGIGGLEGLGDDGQMTLEQAFDGLADVLQQVPSIGDLLGLGRCFGGGLGVGRRAVAADQLDAGMGLEPRLDGRGVAVGQEVDDLAGLEVDDDGAVALSLAPGPVVDADEPRAPEGRSPRLLDATEQVSGLVGMAVFFASLAPASPPRAEPMARWVRASRSVVRACLAAKPSSGSTKMRRGHCRPGAEESADGHPETDLVPEDRLLGERARVAAMDSPGLVSAGGTGCVGVSGRDAEGQGGAIEVGADQATADGARRSWDRSKKVLQGTWRDGETQQMG